MMAIFYRAGGQEPILAYHSHCTFIITLLQDTDVLQSAQIIVYVKNGP